MVQLIQYVLHHELTRIYTVQADLAELAINGDLTESSKLRLVSIVKRHMRIRSMFDELQTLKRKCYLNKFILSLFNQFEENKDLSDKQIESLQNIIDEERLRKQEYDTIIDKVESMDFIIEIRDENI